MPVPTCVNLATCVCEVWPFWGALFAGVGAASLFFRSQPDAAALAERVRELEAELDDTRQKLADANAKLAAAGDGARFSADLSAMARGMSHDFGGPLRAVGEALRIVDEEMRLGNAEMALETLDVIREQMQQLVLSADGLVQYCRRSWLAYPMQSIQVSAFLKTLVDAFDHGGLPPVFVHAPDDTVHIQADALALCCGALVSNAAVHHPRGRSGIIEVKASLSPSDAGSIPDLLVIDVDDDGNGLPLEMREAVFGFFRRGMTRASGAGVGLALARTLAERHGGDVQLLARPGGGLRARLRWPVRRSKGGSQ